MDWWPKIVDMIFEIGGIEYRIQVDSIRITYQSIVSLKYIYTVIMTNLDQRLLSIMANNQEIKILSTQTEASIGLFVEGIIITSDVKILGEITLVTLKIEDKTFNILKRTENSSELIGEFTSRLNEILSPYGISAIKSYQSPINLYEFKRGNIYDTIRDITRSNNIVWNIRGEKIFLGQILSRHEYNYIKSELRESTGFFRSNDDEIIKKYDINMRYNPQMLAGDIISIGEGSNKRKSSFFIAEVLHEFITGGGISTTKSTKIIAISTISELFDYIESVDDDDRIDDIIINKIPELKYDIEKNEIGFKNIKNGYILGDLQKEEFITTFGFPDDYLFKFGREWRDRNPEPTNWDFTKATLPAGAGWVNLDFSAIVPANTYRIRLRINFSNTVGGTTIECRKKGNTNVYDLEKLITILNARDHDEEITATLDENGILEVRFTPQASSGQWQYINMVWRRWM